MKTARFSSLLFVFLFLGLLACGGGGEGLVRPDIVILTLDTTRSDHLGCYGYPRATSPFLDTLAAESILFERCVVPMSVTLPSHVSIMTATYPLEHGILANTFGKDKYYRFPPDLHPFAGACGNAGYETAAFVSATPLRRETGIAAGFETFDEPEEERRSGTETTTGALRWLETHGNGPFLLWVHYYDPHQPLRPPRRFAELLPADDELDEILRGRGWPDAFAPPPAGGYEEVLATTAAYDAEIRFMDDEIGRLLRALRRRPRWEETIVLVAGDHGEGLHQHGILEHGGTWREQLHAPLILRVPGEPSRRVTDPVSLADAVPSLLRFVREPRFDDFLTAAGGRDVLDESTKEAGVVSQDSGVRIGGEGYRYTLTTERWKYARFLGTDGPEELLYDLAADPWETRDVAALHTDITDRLRERLKERLLTLEARGEEIHGGRGAEAGADVDSSVLEELKALGYVE